MKAEIFVPENLSEITLEQYQYLMSIQKDTDSDEFAARKMIAVLCKIALSDVLKIQYSSVTELVQKFQTILREDTPFIHRFSLAGTEFGFIPDLENISFGEYIDAEKYLGDWSTMNNAMAVLYRPIKKKSGDKYEIEPYETSATYAEVMKAAPLNVVIGCQVFFWNLKRDLLSAMMDYLTELLLTMEEETIAEHLNLPKDGDGIRAYMSSLKEMLEDLTTLPSYQPINA